jgi:regulator of PEP synthase PpsR (kinase-PPPase family)
MYELRQAEAMYRNHRLPVINSSTKSVEEMSTVILQALNTRASDREERQAR